MNKIKSIPEEVFYFLLYIGNINMSNNQLSELPQTIMIADNLDILNLQNNMLYSVPHELSLCLKLKSLLVSGNPQKTVIIYLIFRSDLI